MQGEYVAIKLSYNTSFCARRGNGYMHRCEWVGEQPIYIQYHDEEWGVPVYDDRMLFEMFVARGCAGRVELDYDFEQEEALQTGF